MFISCSEDPHSYYETYNNAVQAGLLKRGWMPKIIPASASKIYEQHNIDTNEIWMRFDLPGPERIKIYSALKKLSSEEILKIRIIKPLKADWWFEGLIQQMPANDNALNADIYLSKCEIDKTDAFLAFDRTSTIVYYWCTH